MLALLQNLIPHTLNGAPIVYTLALFTFAVAVALGSIAAARASKNRPNLALVPIGALLMGLFLIDLALLAAQMTPAPQPIGIAELLASITGVHMLIDLAGIAFAGGLFIVPSFAAVQAWSPVERRSRGGAATLLFWIIVLIVLGVFSYWYINYSNFR